MLRLVPHLRCNRPQGHSAKLAGACRGQGSDLDAIGWEMVRTGRTPYGTWHEDGEHFIWNKASSS